MQEENAGGGAAATVPPLALVSVTPESTSGAGASPIQAGRALTLTPLPKRRRIAGSVKSEPGTPSTVTPRSSADDGDFNFMSLFDDAMEEAIKLEDAGVGDGSSSGAPSSAGAMGAGRRNTRTKKPCPGCRREAEIDFEFSSEGNLKVSWAFPGDRGSWCKVCFTVWRTCYSEKQ